MDLSPHGVRATSGSLRAAEGIALPHPWTDEGVMVSAASTGAQVLHLSVALCVLNDTYREAGRLGITVAGVTVEAGGGFDDEWHSTGIDYAVTIDAQASAADLARLGSAVDQIAEIPRALRAGTSVTHRA